MAGASYLFDGNWTVSAGYIFSENSVPDQWFNPGIPDSDRHVFSAGVSKAFDRLSLAGAFQYGYGPSRTIALVWRKRSSLAPALKELAETMTRAYPR